MIGQHNLQSRIEQLIKDRTFPRFSILVGPRGSGKKTFAKWVANQFQKNEIATYFICPDIKVDTIRDIINGAYKIAGTNIYIIPDADNMSNAAKNALLKVTEEPPNNAYFIMTLEDENNTFETIRSRGTVFYMDRYKPSEITDYFYDKYPNHSEAEALLVGALCDTPGDVDILGNIDITEFYDYVQLVVDNIAEVSLANAFKIPSKVVLKEDVKGYDLRLFWRTFICCCVSDEYAKNKRIVSAVAITSRYLQKLRIKGINRQMLMDNWILEIRELWN